MTLIPVESANKQAERPAKAENLGPAHVPATKPAFVKSEQSGDQRFFFITTFNKSTADQAALGYYQILDDSLLDAEVVKQSARKFFFFGPRKTTYKYSLKPIYKKLLQPFLIDVLQMARLKLFVQVSFEAPNIKVNVSGADERLMAKNGFEMLHAFEQIIKVFLTQKIQLPGNVRLNVRLDSKDGGQKDANRSKGARDDNRGGRDRNDRGPRGRGPREGGNDNRPQRTRREMDPKEQEQLIDMTLKAKEEVLEGQKPVLLRPLKAYERRIVHQQLEGDSVVKSTSIGDGSLKQIEISLR